jgi:hypothetical protein
MEAVVDRLQADCQPGRRLDNASRRHRQQIDERAQPRRRQVHLSSHRRPASFVSIRKTKRPLQRHAERGGSVQVLVAAGTIR